MADNLLNQNLLKMARDHQRTLARMAKASFVDNAALAGGGDPAAAGGDPAAAAAGGDPAAAGGDPAAAGGAAPPPGGGGGDPNGAVMSMMQSMQSQLQALQQGGGGGGGGMGAEPLKPKIDVNVEIMQMKNLLAKLVDAVGIPVKAEDMTATPEKLTAMANQQQQAGGGGAPAGGGGSSISPIQPIQPIQGASPEMAATKQGYFGGYAGSIVAEPSQQVVALQGQSSKAAAIARVWRQMAGGTR